MALTRKPNQELSTSPKLIIPRSEARQKLEAHKEKGNEIVNRPINSQSEMDQVEADGEMWRDYTIRLLPIRRVYPIFCQISALLGKKSIFNLT